jgi:hypothetical protein
MMGWVKGACAQADLHEAGFGPVCSLGHGLARRAGAAGWRGGLARRAGSAGCA